MSTRDHTNGDFAYKKIIFSGVRASIQQKHTQLPHGWTENPLGPTMKMSLPCLCAESFCCVPPNSSATSLPGAPPVLYLWSDNLHISHPTILPSLFPSLHPWCPYSAEWWSCSDLPFSAGERVEAQTHTHMHTPKQTLDFSCLCRPFTWFNASIIWLLIGWTEGQVTHLFSASPLSQTQSCSVYKVLQQDEYVFRMFFANSSWSSLYLVFAKPQ